MSNVKQRIIQIFDELPEGTTLTNGELWDRYFAHKVDRKVVEESTKALMLEGKLIRSWGPRRAYSYGNSSYHSPGGKGRACHYQKNTTGIAQQGLAPSLKIIHPDTARLDYLEKECLAIAPADTYVRQWLPAASCLTGIQTEARQ